MSSTSLCDTAASLSIALGAISDASHVFLDCEGTQLGTQGGSLSTIAIGLPMAAGGIKVFIIDAIVLRASLQPLFAVLGAETPFKVMWDGRKDSSEFYHRYGVTLRGVLDMQLADVVSRSIRREGESAQFRRLDGTVKPADLRASPQCYGQVHRLNNLDKCATEHGVRLPAAESSLGSYHAFQLHFNKLTFPDFRTFSMAPEATISNIAQIRSSGCHRHFLNFQAFPSAGVFTDTIVRPERTIHFHSPGKDSPGERQICWEPILGVGHSQRPNRSDADLQLLQEITIVQLLFVNGSASTTAPRLLGLSRSEGQGKSDIFQLRQVRYRALRP